MRDQATFDRVLKCSNLPSPPTVAMRLLELYRDERTSLNKLGEQIALDPVLTAKVLKVANSPAYRLGYQVTSLRQALPLLGMRAVLSLGLSFTIYQRLSTTASTAGFDHRRFWRRSILSAIAARKLADMRQYPMREEIFLAGLLQDIGTLALAQVLREKYDALAARAGDDHTLLAQLEREQLGFDHAEVGAKLLERWSLPPVFTQAIRGTHGIGEVPAATGDIDLAARIVESGSALAELWLDHGNIEDVSRRAYEVAERALGLTYDEVLEVNERVRTAAPGVAEMFSSQIVDTSELDGLAEQARDALVALSIQSAVVAEQAERRRVEVEDRAKIDGLTGVFNRGHIEQALEAQFLASTLGETSLGLIFCDLDHFKRVNDTHGHESGDAVLRAVGRELTASVRPSDLVGRWGGEEFVVILPGSNRQGTGVVAERLRTRLTELEVEGVGGVKLRITASFGVAVSGGMTSYQQLVRAADEAVYASKNAGRNRVTLGPVAAVHAGLEARHLN